MMESQYTVLTFRDLGGDRTELELDVTIVCLDELIPLAESGWSSAFDKVVGLLAQA